MKKLISSSKDCFNFHKDVISKKKNSQQDPNYKTRVSSYNNDIQTKYTEYITNFNLNSLENISPHGFITVEKDTLLKLYSYKFSLIQELKIELTTLDGKVDNTCQYCTIGEVGTLDHILPKETFPEFSVNPKNLFPCCSKCNSKKGENFIEHGIRQFLNLYLDELPEEQYLFVSIDDLGNTIKFKYYLENIHNIDTDLFQLINNHYTKLDLLTRFNENSYNVVSELVSSINETKEHLELSVVKDILESQCEKEKLIYGHNFWKIILKLALINDENFMSRFQ
jgi:hypothetical protein